MFRRRLHMPLVFGIGISVILLVRKLCIYNIKPAIHNPNFASCEYTKPSLSQRNDSSKPAYRSVNQIVTEYNKDVKTRLENLIKCQVAADNLELISLVREMLDPPSTHIIKPSRPIVHTPQSNEIKAVLQNKKGGFFIEVGGFDGERSSNTIALEHENKWNGILIEMDPYYYTQLLGKSRSAWSINACLSPYDYPVEMNYKEASKGVGELYIEGQPIRKSTLLRKVPCFPFKTLMLALNQTNIDFFSLDVEGFELDILKTIDFDFFNITSLSVEYKHGRSGKQAYEDFMNRVGYYVHKDIQIRDINKYLFVNDFIFLKNYSGIIKHSP